MYIHIFNVNLQYLLSTCGSMLESVTDYEISGTYFPSLVNFRCNYIFYVDWKI